jgi:hypothetical protein
VELVECVLGLKDIELVVEDGEELGWVLQVVCAVAQGVSCGCACAVEPVGAGGVVSRVGLDGDLFLFC